MTRHTSYALQSAPTRSLVGTLIQRYSGEMCFAVAMTIIAMSAVAKLG